MVQFSELKFSLFPCILWWLAYFLSSHVHTKIEILELKCERFWKGIKPSCFANWYEFGGFRYTVSGSNKIHHRSDNEVPYSFPNSPTRLFWHFFILFQVFIYIGLCWFRGCVFGIPHHKVGSGHVTVTGLLMRQVWISLRAPWKFNYQSSGVLFVGSRFGVGRWIAEERFSFRARMNIFFTELCCEL